MKFLCRIGLHRWVRVFAYCPDDDDAWLFGGLRATGELCCTRCKKRTDEDSSPPPGDYD